MSSTSNNNVAASSNCKKKEVNSKTRGCNSSDLFSRITDDGKQPLQGQASLGKIF